MASKTSGMVAILRPNEAILDAGDSAYKFQREMECTPTMEIVLPVALCSTRSLEQDIIHFHELPGHPYEKLTYATKRANAVNLTGNLVPCVECSKSEAHKMLEKKTTKTREDGKLGRAFVHFSGPNPCRASA